MLRHRVHLHEQADVIEQRRQGGRDHHLEITDAQELGDEECRRTHHRRRDLSAGRCHGFDGRRIMRLEADALHQRDGHHTRRHDVADRRTADAAEQTRGDHRHLCRTAAAVTHERHGEIGEEPGCAANLHQFPKHDEGQHHAGNDHQHQAGDRVSVRVEIENEGLRREIVGLQRLRQKKSEKPVADEQPDQDGNRQPADLTQGLHHQDDCNGAGQIFRGRRSFDVDQPRFEMARHPAPGRDRDKAQGDVEQTSALAVRHL